MNEQAAPSPVILKQCRHGPLLFLRGDQYIGRSLALYGEFSELEATLFAQIVRPGSTVVEVGANIGAHTVQLARLAGPQGRVHAFEPQRVIHQLLCANVALNAMFNVHTHQAGVGAAAGQLRVPPLDYAGAANFGGISLAAGTAGDAVPIVRLDDMPLPALHFLKVDVEGMEREVLEGARATLARHRPLMYVENDRREKSPALIRLVAELGYRMVWHTPPLFNPENFARSQDNVFPGIVSANMLCVPAESGLTLNGFVPVEGPDHWW